VNTNDDIPSIELCSGEEYGRVAAYLRTSTLVLRAAIQRHLRRNPGARATLRLFAKRWLRTGIHVTMSFWLDRDVAQSFYFRSRHQRERTQFLLESVAAAVEPRQTGHTEMTP
jgi:hypothetical protein